PGEDRQIIDYLSVTQTAEAARQRSTQPAAAPGAGQSLNTRDVAAGAASAARASSFDPKAIAFFSFVGLAAILLPIRRRGKGLPPATVPAVPSTAPAGVVSRQTNAPFILQLAQITPQTADSRTLRFIVRGERKLDALPGQFLTFSFLFDGK